MKRDLESIALFGFAAVAGVVLVLSVVSYRSTRSLVEATTQVRHSQVVLLDGENSPIFGALLQEALVRTIRVAAASNCLLLSSAGVERLVDARVAPIRGAEGEPRGAVSRQERPISRPWLPKSLSENRS